MLISSACAGSPNPPKGLPRPLEQEAGFDSCLSEIFQISLRDSCSTD